MKRPLALFCGTVIIVSLICALTKLQETVTLCLSLFVVSFVIGLIRLKKSKRFFVISGTVLLAFAVFYLGYSLCYEKAISYADDKDHSFYVCVHDEETVKVWQVDGKKITPFKMTVYFEEKVFVGEYLIVSGKAEKPEDTDELYNEALYALSDNIYLQMSSPEITRTNEKDKIIAASDYLRGGIKNRLMSILDKDMAGKVTGILLGDKSGIGIAQKNKYSASGISHMFAVSGLHLAVIVGMLVIFLRLFYIKRKPIAFILAGAVFFFMWLVGFTPSVQRAGTMTIVLCFSYFTNRRADSLTSLCLAGALICMSGPYAAADPGFLLSFLAVLSLITVSKCFCMFFLRSFEILKLRNTLTYKISNILGTSVSVMFFTLPVIVICFGASTILSPLTNMLTLWAVAPILLLAIVLLVLPIKPIAFVLTLLIRYIDKIVSLVLQYDVFGRLFTQKITMILFAAAIVLLIMCKIVGKGFINKAIFAFFILVTVTAGSGFVTNRFDGVTVIQTETYSGNCVLVIEDKKAMAIIDGDFSFAPINAVYGICDSLSEHGIFELDKVVINGASKEFIEVMDTNIEVGDWYLNGEKSMWFGNNYITSDSFATHIKREESSFLVIGKYNNKNFYETVNADVVLFANKCPDVNFMIDRNTKLVISGKLTNLTSNNKNMKILERFFKNNIYTVDTCGTIEIRTIGNGEYDIKTERNKDVYKKVR